METFILIIIIILSLLAIAMFAVFIGLPRTEKNGTYVHIQEGSSIKITQGEDGPHLNIIFDTFETSPSDYELMPDLVNDIVSPTAQPLDFWGDVAVLDTLDRERRKAVIGKLKTLGFTFNGDIGGEQGEDEGDVPDDIEGKDEEITFETFNI